MRRAALLLVLLMVATTSLTGYALAEEDEGYPDGHEEWRVDDLMRLYVEGLNQEEAVLQRNSTDGAVGYFEVLGGSGEVPVFSVSSPPLVNPIEATVNMSVFFSVRLEQAPARSCSATNPFTNGGQETSLRMEVQAGSSTYTSTVQQVIEAVSNDDSELFEGERLEVNLSMQPGEAFTLSLWMQHDCEGTRARVLWGGFEQNAGGIVIEGDIYEPSATLKVDASRRAQVAFSADLPWGADDIDWADGGPAVTWSIWGPLEDDELFTRDGDYLVETSTGRVLIDRVLPGNNTAWTWTGIKEMPIGHVGLEICVTVVGSDPNEDCHATGYVREIVEEPDAGFASSGLWLTLTTMGSLLAFVVVAFRSGLPLPPPILAALLILALAMVPLGIVQDNLGEEAVVDDSIRLGDPSMNAAAGTILSPSEVMDGADLMLVSVLMPGSENGADHLREFETAMAGYDGDVAVLTVIIGQDALMTDATAYVERYNVTWPVLLDSTGDFAASLPTGEADAVVVVDRAGRVSSAASPTQAYTELGEAMTASQRGGSQSASTYLRLAFGPCLFLLFLALPRVGWEKPEEPLPPGTLWGSIIVSAGAGVALVNLPSLLLTFIPFDAALGSTLDLISYLWFIEMAVVTAIRGAPFESDLLGRLIHRLTPEVFQRWRAEEDLARDVLLGVWVGWFAWFAEPAMFAQGVGAAMLSGVGGILIGLLNGVLFAFVAGLVVLLLRIVAGLGGPLSRMFGLYGAESFARFSGWALVPIGVWVTINHVLFLISIGVL